MAGRKSAHGGGIPEAELDALYALPVEEFTPAKRALAKRLRDAGSEDAADEVLQLPKPSLAAWVVNQLARQRPDDVRALLDSGARLKKAQQEAMEGKGAEALREGTRAQRGLVLLLTEDAADLLQKAGKAASPATRDQIQGSLTAAANGSDEERELLAQGRLSKPLERVSFGGLVDVRMPAAAPKAEARQAKAEAGQAEREQARADERARAAERERREAERAAKRAARQREQAERRADKTSARERADRERREARQAERAAREAERRAAREAERAAKEAERAAKRVEREREEAERRAALEARKREEAAQAELKRRQREAEALARKAEAAEREAEKREAAALAAEEAAAEARRRADEARAAAAELRAQATDAQGLVPDPSPELH